MMKYLFLLLLCTLSTLFSCKGDLSDIKGNYFLFFYPRHCECITTKILSHKERPQNWYIYHLQQELQAQDADLWVVTGTDSLARIPSFKMSYSPAYYLDIMQTDSFPLAERNHKLEQQLDYDYRTNDGINQPYILGISCDGSQGFQHRSHNSALRTSCRNVSESSFHHF